MRVAADMHLIGGAEVAMPRIVWLVYSAVTRRNQPIAKIANDFVKISQIVEANRLRPDRRRCLSNILNTTVP